MTPRALKIHWKGLLQQGKSIEFPSFDGPFGTSWGLVAQRKLIESLRFVLKDLLERRGDPLQEVEGSSKKREVYALAGNDDQIQLQITRPIAPFRVIDWKTNNQQAKDVLREIA